MISALNGSALQQKNSFLLNKLNEKIASDRLTLTDEPHLVKASGARYFDNEGIATERRSIFDKGVLNTYGSRADYQRFIYFGHGNGR